MNTKSIQTEIKRALARSGLSASAASRQAAGNTSLVKNILNGHMPRADSLIRLVDVLGLEFYIGSPRTPKNLNKKNFNSENTVATVPNQIAIALDLSTDAGVDEVLKAISALLDSHRPSDDMVTLRDEIAALRADIKLLTMQMTDTQPDFA